MIELIGLERLGDVPHQPAGQDLRHVGLDQLGVGRNQRAGKVGQQVVDLAVAAQGLDHRVQPAELLAEPRVQGRLTWPSTGTAGDRSRGRAGGLDLRPRPARDRRIGRHGVGGRDLDQRPRTQAEQPAAPDLARRQDHGVAAQVPAHPRQGLLHRLGAVGFRSHQPCLYQ